MATRSEAQRDRRRREAFAAGRFVVVNGFDVEPDRQRCRMTRLGMMHAPSCRHQTDGMAEEPIRPRGRPRMDRRSEAQKARRARERGEVYVPLTGGINGGSSESRLASHEAGAETTSEQEIRSLGALTNGVSRIVSGPTGVALCRGCGFNFYFDANHDSDYCSCKCDPRPVGQNGSCYWADWDGGHCEHSDMACSDCWPLEGQA